MDMYENLPKQGADVLSIEDKVMPAVVETLIRKRALSGLVQTLHQDMLSDDPSLKRQAELALKKLGFSE